MSFPEFINALKVECADYPCHIFRANWQHKQMLNCLNNLADHEVMMVMDFAENYSCKYFNDVSPAYFDPVQVTVHPMMYYYYQHLADDEHSSDQSAKILVKHSITAISNDMKHDSYLVEEFEEASINLLKEQGKEFVHIYQWSDSCAAQYKCKATFACISMRSPDMPTVTRNYFETSHGKSVCNGLGAVVKNTAYQAVLTGTRVIANAQDLMRHCQESLQHDLRENKSIPNQRVRDFISIDGSDVERNTPDTLVKSVTGTRQLHAARGFGSRHNLDGWKLMLLSGMQAL